MFLHYAIPEGGIHLAKSQIVRAAMFLYHTRSPLLVVQEKLKTFNVVQTFGASISLRIWGIHLAGNQVVTVAMFLHNARSPLLVVQEMLRTLPLPVFQEKLKTFNVVQTFGASISLRIWGIHLAGNQVVTVAMFLHNARSPLLVVQEMLRTLPLPVFQEKLKTFNVVQAFRTSILLRIWDIHLARNQTVRVAMFLHHMIPQGGIHLAGHQIARVVMFVCHIRSPLLVVQERLKTFNVAQAFEASILLRIWGIHLAGNQIVRVAMCLPHARSPLLVVQEKSLLVV